MQTRNANVNCKEAIEEAIRKNFDGMHLEKDAHLAVVKEYGLERVQYVLANTIQEKEWDGRFSAENRVWADRIEVIADVDKWGVNRNAAFIVNSHPTVLNGFVDMIRKMELEKIRYEDSTEQVEQINTFFVAECMEFPTLGEYHEGLTLDEAKRIYESIPADRMNGMKGIGLVVPAENEQDIELTVDILSGYIVDIDTIDMIQEFKENPVIQKAIRLVSEVFTEEEIKNKEIYSKKNLYRNEVSIIKRIDKEEMIVKNKIVTKSRKIRENELE